jgi:glycosyltransferase involved in cell wall biosynthesis
VDVEDLFDYALGHSRPTGIQRLAMEAYAALYAHDRGAGKIKFVRHAVVGAGFRVVAWAEVAALFAQLTQGSVADAPKRAADQETNPRRELIRRRMHLLPGVLRPSASDALLATILMVRAWGLLAAVLVREAVRGVGGLMRLIGDRRGTEDATHGMAGGLPAASFDAAVRPGDVILALGAPWSFPNYAARIEQLRERRGLRFAMLVYDLIPIRRPEWFAQELVRHFGQWIAEMLPLCDHLFAISHATAHDLVAHMAKLGVAAPPCVVTLPIGSGVSLTPVATEVPAGGLAGAVILPQPGSYAVFVSTIEVRKNHLLLFRVWRRLLEELPPEQVPTLVFAGRVGWLVEDLMAQIRGADHLGGKLVVMENLNDDDLVRLYQGCLFSLFPSFYEGWGLPVTESLALGKPCLISNRSSLPEAGGALARSFDPDNLNDAYAVIRQVIVDREDLARWQDEVRQSFRPVPWSATAAALMAELTVK